MNHFSLDDLLALPLLAWIPDWVIGLAALVTATVAALTLYAGVRWLVEWAFARRHPVALTFLSRTSGPTRLALVMIAWRLTLELAPVDEGLTVLARSLLALAFIALMGWIAMRVVAIASAIYLRRFRLDVEDNLLARKHVTQVNILRRATETLVIIFTIAAGLMSFDSVRQYGVSLFASAGAAGLLVGFAARPVLSNLIAGIQIAVTQPIRVDDAVIVENEWGWVEEITATYVVLKLWDWRRLVVPLTYFIEKPFQNWTRESSALIGTVIVHVDYAAPVARIRDELDRIVQGSKLWDRRVVALQVTDATPRTLELRALVSARNASITFDLRCEVREKLIAFLQSEMPEVLPRLHGDFTTLPDASPAAAQDTPLAPDHPALSAQRTTPVKPVSEPLRRSPRPD